MIYADDLDEATIKQYEEAIDQPFVVQSALMADAHLGYTLPIGGVVATKDYIVPSWVGYDIGCGMLAVKLSCSREEIDAYTEEIYSGVLKVIPVGFHHHKKRKANDKYYKDNLTPALRSTWDKKGGTKQLGTLGGGNHFIEIGYDLEDNVWVIIHSGSRGIGHAIASHYIRLAHPEGKLKEGSYALEADSKYGRDYLNDLMIATGFAKANRDAMFTSVLGVLEGLIGPITYTTEINKTHNHIKMRKGLYVHRKGATHAEKGMAGVIPGNMKDGSYIVEGLGEALSISSASHGAGRKYGRKAAKRELDIEKFSRDMVGIKAKVTNSTLDESPDAYKDLNTVMANQSSLVTIKTLVKPMINIKG